MAVENWCDQCYEQAEKVFRCGQCQAAVYCSQDCQRRAWKCHKTMCKPVPRKKAAVQEVKPRPSPEAEAAAEAAAERQEEERRFRSELLLETQRAVTGMLAAVQESLDDPAAYLPRLAELRRDFEGDIAGRLRLRQAGLRQEPSEEGDADLGQQAPVLARELAKEVLLKMLQRGNAAHVSRDLLEIGNNHFSAGLLQKVPAQARALPDEGWLEGFEEAAAQVRDSGFTCVEGLLDEDIAGVIFKECQEKFWQLRDIGAMHASAGPEASGGYECHVPYPSRACVSPELHHALRILYGLPHEIARNGYPVPLHLPTMAQLGCLPAGASERLHLDNNGTAGSGSRELTIVLFCNPEDTSDVSPVKDGAFRAFLDGNVPGPRPDVGAADDVAVAADVRESKRPYRDIQPAAGTCLIFQSRRLWHELLPARRLQFALTLFVYGAD